MSEDTTPVENVPEHETQTPAVKRKSDGRWAKGQTGNPSGRPRGMGWTAQQRLELRKCVTPVFAALFKASLAGDSAASRLLLERVLPPLKTGDDLVSVDVQGSLSDRAKAILDMVTSGAITPGTGAELLALVNTTANIVAGAELEQRIAALEARQA